MIGVTLLAAVVLVLVALRVYDLIEPSQTPDASLSYAGFLADLQTEGANVQEVSHGGPGQDLPSTAHVLLVNDSKITVYEYATTQDAANDAARISPDGSTIQSNSFGDTHVTVIDYIAPPHWFRQGHVLVLYVGCDSDLMGLLQQVLGAPFAGDGAVDNPCPDRLPVTPTP